MMVYQLLESHVVTMLGDTTLCSIPATIFSKDTTLCDIRVTIFSKDIQLARRIRGERR